MEDEMNRACSTQGDGEEYILIVNPEGKKSPGRCMDWINLSRIGTSDDVL
jgi:hypothetical protein